MKVILRSKRLRAPLWADHAKPDESGSLVATDLRAFAGVGAYALRVLFRNHGPKRLRVLALIRGCRLRHAAKPKCSCPEEERERQRERERERNAEREREKRESFGVSLNIGGLSLLGDHLIVVLQCKREYPHH